MGKYLFLYLDHEINYFALYEIIFIRIFDTLFKYEGMFANFFLAIARSVKI